ncbi:monooxygenase [Microdochium bolleyi]|uniref:Monooxygenase n=1 Tax=Microdochium bolleyi TaxID=196109 RepID=A0A136IVC6_9PEZI|nr:monooxygenase [Microdochium bolleyi]
MSPSANREFHVAIAGAGVAGLALAMALYKQGVSFTLYEEAPEYSAVGAGIGFAPNGTRTMDLIDPAFRPLYEEICVGNKLADAQNIFFEGHLVQEGLGRDQAWASNCGWGHPNYVRKSAHRKALLDVMTSFFPIENVKFSKRLDKIEQTAEGVTLTFSDGTTAEADVLAGADGIQSTVRAEVLGATHPEQIKPVYAGCYVYRAVIPIEEADAILGDRTDVAKIYFGDRRGCVTYRISKGAEFNYLLLVADDKDGWKLPNAVTERVTYESMMADFADPKLDERFRQLLSKAKPLKWGLFHHWKTATYARDRVCILGDSAHASLPFQAAGAAQGLEDALVLANVLARIAELQPSGPAGESDMPVIRAGMEAYDAVRRPRAQRQLEQAYDMQKLIFFEHEDAGSDMARILPHVQNGRYDWLWFHDTKDDVDEALRRMDEALASKSKPQARI